MKTAIEWLVEQLKINNYLSDNAHWLIDVAKEIEKQQIIDARLTAPLINTPFKSDYIEEAEQYYNETFKK